MQRTLALAAVPILAAIACGQSTKPSAEGNYAQFKRQISGKREILHALNRLTFGPRPADVAAVEKMGLNKWIELQLHPERIPENEALAKLVEPLVEPTSFFQVVVGDQVTLLMKTRKVMPQAQLSQLITETQVALLRNGSDQQALAELATLPRDKVVQVLAAMPAVRLRLLPLLDADLRRKVEAAAPGPVGRRLWACP